MTRQENKSELAVSIDEIEQRIVVINKQRVLVDADVARFYGVETKYINRAVKNNPRKFPEGYAFTLDFAGQNELVQNLHRFDTQKHSSVNMTVFTEKGLYMLATILRGDRAIDVTMMIIEAFARLRELGRTISEAIAEQNKSSKNELAEQCGNLFLDLVEDSLPVSATETSFELNFPLVKVKKLVKREK